MVIKSRNYSAVGEAIPPKVIEATISGCEVFRGHTRNSKTELCCLARSKCRSDSGDKESALIGIRVSVGFFTVNTDIKADVRVSNALRVNDRENEVAAFSLPDGLSIDIRKVAPLTRMLESFLASGINTAVDGGTSISR